MLTMRVELLTGRYVATAYNDRRTAEWPPHPARLFSALVATWANADEPDAAERTALEWLERAGAPLIRASTCAERDVMTHYVPVNDTTVLPDLSLARARLLECEHEVEKVLVAVSATEAVGGNTAALARKLERARKKSDAQRQKLRERTASAVAVGRRTDAGVKAAEGLLPGGRLRQPRHFPSVTPEVPVVELTWSADPPPEVRAALAGLGSRVIRLGHSSSLVNCAVVERAGGDANWCPDEDGQELLRVPLPGQLERLEAAFELHGEIEPRVLPCRFERYRHGAPGMTSEPAPRPVLGDDWIVFRRAGGPAFHATRAVDVAYAVRGALLSFADDPPPETISGHREDGSPARRPHVAVIPLPFVGHEHADGRLLGVAIVLPRNLPPSDRQAVLRAVGRWEEASRLEDEETPIVPVQLGAAGVLELERIAWGEAGLSGLRSSTWCRPSKVWMSATPVALDRNPGHLRARDPVKAAAAHREAEGVIAHACQNIGLPEPVAVTVLPSITMPGVTKAQQFPPFPPRDGGPRRVKVHVRVEFPVAVCGPLILGAGRYFGLGLMRPCAPRASEGGLGHADS